MNRRVALSLVAGLGISLVLISGTLVFLVLNRPIYYVGVRTSATIQPGEVPVAALRDFALVYLSTFETYTPQSLEHNDKHLQRFVSPDHYSELTMLLLERRQLVVRGQISSMFAPGAAAPEVVPTGQGTYQVCVSALRKIYLSDKLNRSSKVQYTVQLQVSPPTFPNPYGLFVTGHGVREIAQEPIDE